VQGYPVLGPLSKLEEMVSHGQVDTVLVSCRGIDPERLASVERLAAQHGIKLTRLYLNIELIDTLGPRPLRFPSRASGGS
jgi:hypothetical protein